MFKREVDDRNSQELVDNTDTQYVQKSNEFGIQLFKQVSAQASDGNVVISPFSIGACLSLAAMGAGGETADEMFAGLRYGKADQKQQVAEWYGRLMDRLANEASIAVANKIYVQEGCTVKRSFDEMATKSFQSKVEKINFPQNETAAKTMNDWVERKTNNKIKDLITPDALNGDTRMVLVNALYFKDFWSYELKKRNTQPMLFWSSDIQSREVPMMCIRMHFAYKNFEAEDFSAIELTYEGNQVTMLVLLPNTRDGLAALEERLPSLEFAKIRDQMTMSDVKVYLPKFKIDFSLELDAVLKSLGMARMLSNYAEFPDLLEPNEKLKFSKVVHKAFIDVNEEGTEAAAATGVYAVDYFELLFPPSRPLLFKADHPFIYALMSKDKGVYFIGKLTNPVP